MRSQNSKAHSTAESLHLERVKLLPCSVCGQNPPSEAHHVVQGQHFITIALCKDCHTGSENGIHGRRTMWRIFKMDEWRALNVTIRRMMEGL